MILDRKILVGFICCSLALTVVAVISFRNSKRFIDTNQWVSHAHDVLAELDQVLISAVDAETSARGFVITSDESYLRQFDISKANISEHISRVNELTSDNVTQQTNISEIKTLAGRFIQHLEAKVNAGKKNFEEARAYVLTGEGKRLEDEIRRAVKKSKDLEQSLLIERRQTSQQHAGGFNLIFAVLMITIVIVLITLYFIISSNLMSLKRAQSNSADRNWTLSGSTDLIKGMQGNKQLPELSETIICHLASYLNAHIGGLYITDDGGSSLNLSGGYGIDEVERHSQPVRFGESLVGQAATEKKTILISKIPTGYFNLNTSFGRLVPKNIIAVPFLFENRVVGVIELGTIHDFTPIQQQYLDIVADSIAIAITSAQARTNAKQLLDETQRQAMELEAKQEGIKQANEELRKSEERYHLMIGEVQDYAILLLDKNGVIENWNKGAEKIKGYTAEEAVGNSFRMFYTEEDLVKNIPGQLLSTAARKGKADHEGLRVKKDGSTFWGSVVLTALHGRDGEIIGFSKVTRDLTERKAAEDELKRNAAALEEKNKVLGQSELELKSQQEELTMSNEELQAKTELLEKSELELKMQQEELKQVNEELEEKANVLEQQKKKLQDAKSQLEAKARELEIISRYKTEFLANMSHELRTPLNSILILSQLLSDNKHSSLDKKDLEFARTIHNSGRDLLSLIDEVLDLAKIEAGKMQLDVGEFRVKDIVTSLTSQFSQIAKGKSVEFDVDFTEKTVPATMSTDRQKVEQVLKNLLSNAFKFTRKGGKVTLRVARGPAEGHFMNSPQGSIAFSVSDTGIGIPESLHKAVFDAFHQADGSTKRKFGGTGLGLSISRELAAVLGGEIKLESQEGKGSTFTVNLPVRFDSSRPSPASREVEIKQMTPEETAEVEQLPDLEVEPETAIDDRKSITEKDRIVLIIEDEKHFAAVLLDFVRERNYKGIIASHGSIALRYARQFRPDAILLDMNLPVMDGAQVLKQMKHDPELRHIPVQIISSYDRRNEGMNLGAFNYIQKPVSIPDLKSAFDRIEQFSRKKVKKLLIIEDDEVQNNAIKELIGNSDVKSLAAYNGTQAYEMLTSNDFDCVIVDLGLPDMTGFELLENIKENNSLNKIPIIVYTGRDLKKEESDLLSKLANTVVLKTANSRERLLDETMLFLHRVESRLPKDKQSMIRKLHKSSDVLKDKKVLLVDDDIRNIFSLTSVLEKEGVECIPAENGKLAIQALRTDPSIDLVLMDVMMPEMDGYEATLEIRRMPEFRKLPIIAVTAKAMKGDKEKCLEAGMSDYVSKPVNIEQLLALMRVWLYK